MNRIFPVLLAILVVSGLYADYSSLTPDEKKKVVYAFEKSKVYNDLISGSFTVKIISVDVLKKEPVEKSVSWFLVRVVFDKIPKSTPGDRIRTQVDFPVKITVSSTGVPWIRVVVYVVVSVAGGFAVGRAIQ